MANSYLFRNFTSAGNRKTFTFSAWVKFSDSSSISTLFATGADSENRLIFIRHDSGSGSTLKVDGKTSTNQTIEVRTNRAFRDTNAWYHIVLRVDTTQNTAADRVRIYVNGVQETSFAQSTYPSQDYDTEVNKTANHMVGRYSYSASNYLNGYMSHAAFVDGASLAPTSFGETDSTSGIWKFKAPSGITWGTNGFHLKFENSGNLGLDSAGSNNFTVGGNLKQALDTPSNVYVTMNPLINSNSNLTFANGNTKIATTSQWLGSVSTFPMFQGKYYWEFKGDPNFMIGVSQLNSDATETRELSIVNSGYSSRFATGYEIINGGNKSNNNNSSTSYGSSYSSSDIGMVAFDATNGVLWFGKNGAWQNSATQTQIENGTTTNAAYTGLTNDNGYVVSCSVESGHMEFNFGNGFFGTTAITSAGSNGNGSLFEYDVPSGYYALNTKNLNTHG